MGFQKLAKIILKMKTKNKNGKKKRIQINYEVDNMFSTSIKNGEMNVIGYVDDNNFADFVKRYLTDILDVIPTKSLGMVESYIKLRMEEKPVLNNNRAVFSNEQINYIKQTLKVHKDVSIEDMCFGKPTESIGCFIFSEHNNPVNMNLGYFDAELDAFMFNPITNGKCEEVSKVLGYIPFRRNENC